MIGRHIRNIFKENELEESSVCAKFAHTAADGKTYSVQCYSLDVIISVGYRVKSNRGVEFRQWATNVLKRHLIEGYTIRQNRLKELGASSSEEILDLLASTLKNHSLVKHPGDYVLDIIQNYAKTWHILLEYDEGRLSSSPAIQPVRNLLEHRIASNAISALKSALKKKNEASELFGIEKQNQLQGILHAVEQTFDQQPLYKTYAERSAHLLYFLIKDHPFVDGNKRIGCLIFTLYLKNCGMKLLEPNALIAISLLIAESKPKQKEILIRLLENLLDQ